MRITRRFLSLLLVMVLFVTPLANSGLAEIAGNSQSGQESKAQYVNKSGEALTWASGSKLICGLLGILSEDAADIDLALYADTITEVTASDDSVYVALLADRGYLNVSQPVEPFAEMPREQFDALVMDAFGYAATTPEDAAALAPMTANDNLLIAGEVENVSAIEAGSVAVVDGERLTISGAKLRALSIAQGGEVYLARSELERVLVNADEQSSVYLHIDVDTKVPEVVLEGAGEFVLEGGGALGLVRVKGNALALTVRATGSVLNETQADISVTGPDGENVELAPGEQVDFVLTKYIVSFVTDGSPVATQEIAPGGTVDFGAAKTELAGKVFTAWYEDADLARPYSMLSAVDSQLTLHARFIDESEAAIITFETFGGRELEPLVFAKGENLLCKPASGLYTSKEGYSFGGWCVDAECTQSFGYTDTIMESMTLYAMFTSNEIQVSESGNNIENLTEFDWQGSIPLVVPEGMSLEDARANVTISASSGVNEPVLSFRETGSGLEVYAEYFDVNGQKGFEPGASITLTVSNGVLFAGHSEEIDTLVVDIYREEVEIVEFSDALTYVLWDDVSQYEPVGGEGSEYSATVNVDGDIDETETQTDVVPGMLLFEGDADLAPDDIVVFYDGDIGADERNISTWRDGSLDGYVLFAQIVEVREADGKTEVAFVYANPVDYLAAFDVHTNKELDIEDQIGEADIARIERSISDQVSSNEELRAQMLVSVMTSPETQTMLDDMYGSGVYSLAAATATIAVGSPTISLSVSGNTATASISISATITLSDQGKTIMVITPKLSFIQEVSLNTSIDGGFVWIDVAITIKTKSTIRLEVLATSGGDSAILAEAKSTLEEMVNPNGLTDEIDYEQSFNKLMETMQSLVSTNLVYNELFVVPLLTVVVTFYGIISLTVKLELVGQIGVLATFGIEIIVTNGQRMGFEYDFLLFEGGSYSDKLPGDVRNQIYLIGKIGVKLGLRLTVSISVCSVVSVSIKGEIFAYAELTGMFFYTASLLSGESTYVGALYFEVGLDAAIGLTLSADIKIKTVKKSWTLWKDRWPLYSLSRSTDLVLMNLEQLDLLWAQSIQNVGGKTVFGFDYVPMKTYMLLNGQMVENQVLWESPDAMNTMRLEIANLRINGEPAVDGDPRNAVLLPGTGENGRSRGKIYVDEAVAAEYMIESVDCDVIVTYENTTASALVKKQVRTYQFSREMTLATTTVNVQIALYDWCAHTWGIDAAEWDNEVVYTARYVNTHVLGAFCEPTRTEQLDLSSIMQTARSSDPAFADLSLQWFAPTRNQTDVAVQYSVPRISNFCYLTPDSDSIRYDIHPETYETTLTWYVYVARFPGYSGEVLYTVRYPGAAEADEYSFYVKGSDKGENMPFVQTELGVWTLTAPRNAFDGTDQPLMMAKNGAEAIPTGYTINGREQDESVEISLTDMMYSLSFASGRGVEGFEILSPQIASGDGVLTGEQVQVDVSPSRNYRNVWIKSEPDGIIYKRAGNTFTFVMPANDVTVTFSANLVRRITYNYNYGDSGVYKEVGVAQNEKITEPAVPLIEGLTFRGWYTTPDCMGDPYVFGDRPDDDLQLYADWTCNVTVDFGAVSGQAVYMRNELPEFVFEGDATEYARFTYSTLHVGEKPLDIVLPNYSGHDFMGWYLTSEFDGEPVDMAVYELTGGITLYARWVKFVNITYMWNYGDAGQYDAVIEHKGLPLEFVPESPSRDYYTFSGWYTAPSCAADTAFDTAVDLPQDDTMLYAGWTADEYAITYDLAGGENDSNNPGVYTVETGDFTLHAPTRTGYDFAGWTGTDLTAATIDVSLPTSAPKVLSYAATWTPATYTITCDLVRGTLASANPESYTIESMAITLVNPSMDKYEFKGWTGTGLTEPTMQVVIPAGSIGNRSYTATWTTEDTSSQIADFALMAIPGQIDYTIDEFEIDIPFTDVRSTIDTDADCGPYSGDIELTLEQQGDTIEGDTDYTYSYLATVTYTDDAGNSLEREKTVTVTVAKRVPVISDSISTGDILYGQTLAQSQMNNTVATYDTEDLSGTFNWEDPTIVPLGANNGVAMYTIVFTPEDTGLYAVVEFDVAVNTQIGVAVAIEAEDRDYIADSTAATGTYTLTDADTETALSTVSLTGGTWAFPQAAPGSDLTVTYTGYSLVTEEGEESLYVLVNTSVTDTASINKIKLSYILPSAVVFYGDILRDVALTGGSANYDTSSAPTIAIDGSWSWTTPSQTATTIGDNEFSVTFTPTDTVGYSVATMEIVVVVRKRVIPVPVISSKQFNGSTQTATITDTEAYTVTSNEGGTNAGDYDVVLTLRNTDYYCWEGAEDGVATCTVKFTITPAALTVEGTVSVMRLGYGQKLTAGEKNGDLELTAQEMISGLTVKNNGTVVSGTWTWDVTGLSQPLDASDPDDSATNGNGHLVQAVFVPTSSEGSNYEEMRRTFVVVIERSVPDLTGCTLSASALYQPSTNPCNALIESSLSCSGNAVNPVTGEKVSGSWSWEDSARIPTPSNKTWKAVFNPSSGNNYTTVMKDVDVPFRDFVYVTVRGERPDSNKALRKPGAPDTTLDSYTIQVKPSEVSSIRVDFNRMLVEMEFGNPPLRYEVYLGMLTVGGSFNSANRSGNVQFSSSESVNGDNRYDIFSYDFTPGYSDVTIRPAMTITGDIYINLIIYQGDEYDDGY